ncbi:DUF1830 domain-containing protein [Candidatus Synechococcus calcipolaris G9]|uniref:DUF1830 domain-containing protein n=1 Tax=Candidatus Synechococcus calcipolaris G9 TaxID=1497997 RepID=A0ABT6F1U4_9SYNE|nr:DUF1830 domain-containing protein [Candidatus Synechococcus calcipolaris]MDG2991827.1 DUF1830 domain-containing protein [Candidatus Synechococcus calcipolaris G9]
MPQLFDPVPSDRGDRILCCYVNATNKMQIARITNIPNWYFERVVFPGQRLVFETPRDAQLEIHSGMMASAILSDTISCERLLLQEGDNNFFPNDPHVQQRLEEINEGIPVQDDVVAMTPEQVS